MGGERHGESKMSGSRAQYNDLAKSWTQNLLMWSPVHQPLGNCFFPKKNYREVIVYPRSWNNTQQIKEQSIYAINEHWDYYLLLAYLTQNTQTSVSIFLLLFSIHFLWHWQGDLV